MSSGNASPDIIPCAVCKGPYHPSTGGLHWVEFSQRDVPWCGACERDFVKWFVRHQKAVQKKVMVDGKKIILKFYDYNYPPADQVVHGPDGERKADERDG